MSRMRIGCGEIPGFDPEAKVLERRLEHPLPWPER